jgi:hypothetical protein
MLMTEAVLIAGTMSYEDCRKYSYTEGGNRMLKSMCYARIFQESQFEELVRLIADRSHKIPIGSPSQATITYERTHG